MDDFARSDNAILRAGLTPLNFKLATFTTSGRLACQPYMNWAVLIQAGRFISCRGSKLKLYAAAAASSATQSSTFEPPLTLMSAFGRRLQTATSSVQSSFHRSTKNKHRLNKMAMLESLNFDNLALRSLPIDPEEEIHVRQVKGACFSKMKLSPVANPQTVCVSSSALQLLDLCKEQWQRPEFAEYFAGNKLLPGSQLAAHCYCGHQFGYFAGQLGDGAAM